MRYVYVESININEGLRGQYTAPLVTVSCSDFRYIDETFRFLSNRYPNQYDQIVLPGSSGGVMNIPDWKVSFLEQIDILIGLHDQDIIYIVDHEDCGMYKAIYGNSVYNSNLYRLHALNMSALRALLHEMYPRMLIRSFLLLLDGKILELIE